jgi:hypothetical protein
MKLEAEQRNQGLAKRAEEAEQALDDMKLEADLAKRAEEAEQALEKKISLPTKTKCQRRQIRLAALKDMKVEAERRNQVLAKRAEEAEQALEAMKVEAERRNQGLAKRAEEAEQALEAMKVECTLLHSLITQFLQDPLNETTETTAGGPPKKRARNEQPEENTEN